jgi:Na+-driven multidrug efflux pump
LSSSPNPLLARPILPTLLRLSVPNLIAMMATALVAIAETSYVGLLGTAPLAAMALVFPMVMLQQMMSSGAMGGGISSAIARALGAGDELRARALALHAVVIGLVVGAAFTTLFLLAGPWIYRALGGADEVLAQATAYSNIVFLGAIPVWLTNSFASILRGTGNMRVPSLLVFGVAALQIVIGGGLGLGIGPLPRLGMPGVALGQVAAFAIGALVLFRFLRSGRARVRLALDPSLIRLDMFRDILRVGAIACVSPLMSVANVLIVTGFVAGFGVEALAGYGIGVRLEFLLVPIAFAIGVASVPMVGMAIGAGLVERARRVAWTSGGLSFSVVGAFGLAAALFPDLWSGLFTADPAVRESTRVYFAWAGPSYGFFGLALSLYFASQGAGRMLGPVLAQAIRLAIVAIGGWWIAGTGAPAGALFAVVAAAMVAYGCATAVAVHNARWGARR